MDYSYAEYNGADTVLVDIKNFNLNDTLNCGQAFRWNASGVSGDVYRGVAYGRQLELCLEGSNIILKNVTLSEFESVWKNYFGLGYNYGELKERFSQDKNLQKALAFSPGIRVMHQDLWETLVTFIISQNNNIPRIKGIVQKLCEHFGKPLSCNGFTFPAPDVIASLTAEDLAPIRSGYRAGYIIDAARLVAGAELRLDELNKLSSEGAHLQLMRIKGVGPKVAECVLLYGLGRVERYPLDVWMKRVMTKLYPKGFPEGLRDVAGIAQQFLFHYARAGQGEIH